MPPKLNTTPSPARLARNAAVRRAESSPRYCAQERRSPRLARASMRKARCLSWRFPTRISSPMMKAPNKSGCLFRPALQVLEAADMLAIDENLRHRAAARDRSHDPGTVAVVQLHFSEIVSEVLEQHLGPRAESAAFPREDGNLVGFLRIGIDVIEHGVGVGYFEGVAG